MIASTYAGTKMDHDITGSLLHLVNNTSAGLITDMTTACPLNNWRMN